METFPFLRNPPRKFSSVEGCLRPVLAQTGWSYKKEDKMKDFYAIIDLHHEEEMLSNRPACFHKIFGRRVIDYMLRALAQASPKDIIVLAEKAEFCHYLEDAAVPVICKGRDMTSVDDIMREYGKDAAYLVLPGAVMFDVVDVVGALREASQRGLNMINIADAEGSGNVFVIKNRVDLVRAAKIVQQRANHGHMLGGVTIIDPENTYIGPDPDVKIGMDTIIYPGVTIEGSTTIGKNCIIGQGCHLVDMKIGDGVEIWNSTCLRSQIGDGTSVGPYAFMRNGAIIGKNCRIGVFVEVKNATVGDDTKASHLSYIGDATIGENVNIGCGAITVNYDGKVKSQTIVEDNVFVGCNTNLIAPVTVGKGAFIAAGSTITDNIPPDALGIARERQTNKEGWVKRR
jgi:bifunctional N-acetylglucosamine-1-phosphate-uridyltransferase/glucosamine-1-phosphate-acetyltransferase GlmU-like protein